MFAEKEIQHLLIVTKIRHAYMKKKILKKLSAAPAIPGRSPIPVLRWPDVA